LVAALDLGRRLELDSQAAHGRGVRSSAEGSTRQMNAARGELGRLWQGRFFDHALRTLPVAPVSSPATFGDGDIAATTPREARVYPLESAAPGTGKAAERMEVVERP
jgi:hypothetical protein